MDVAGSEEGSGWAANSLSGAAGGEADRVAAAAWGVGISGGRGDPWCPRDAPPSTSPEGNKFTFPSFVESRNTF